MELMRKRFHEIRTTYTFPFLLSSTVYCLTKNSVLVSIAFPRYLNRSF